MNKPLIPKVSRVKPLTQNEALLHTACRKAIEDERPFTIEQGYDSDKIGSYVEFTIWYPNESGESE